MDLNTLGTMIQDDVTTDFVADKELNELELALVGGGIGDTIAA